MEPWVQQIAVPLAVAVLTSSGLWALIGKRRDKNDVERKMLVGLAHDRIIHLGMAYLTRGYITQDEYENLNDYLYQPDRADGRQRQCEKGHGGSEEAAHQERGVKPERIKLWTLTLSAWRLWPLSSSSAI